MPKPLLTQQSLSRAARTASTVRLGWAEAARKIAEAGDDPLVMGEFGNTGDTDLVWFGAEGAERRTETSAKRPE